MGQPIGILVMSLLLVLSTFSAVHFAMSFMNDLHTLDLSYNMCLIANDLKDFGCVHEGNVDYRAWADRTSSGNVRSYEDGYIDGIGRFISDLINFGLSCFALGLMTTATAFSLLDQKANIDGKHIQSVTRRQIIWGCPIHGFSNRRCCGIADIIPEAKKKGEKKKRKK